MRDKKKSTDIYPAIRSGKYKDLSIRDALVEKKCDEMMEQYENASPEDRSRLKKQWEEKARHYSAKFPIAEREAVKQDARESIRKSKQREEECRRSPQAALAPFIEEARKKLDALKSFPGNKELQEAEEAVAKAEEEKRKLCGAAGHKR